MGQRNDSWIQDGLVEIWDRPGVWTLFVWVAFIQECNPPGRRNNGIDLLRLLED